MLKQPVRHEDVRVSGGTAPYMLDGGECWLHAQTTHEKSPR
jgi:hypothetical protein